MTKHIVFRKGKHVSLGVPGTNYLHSLLGWLNDPEVTQYLKRYQPMALNAEREYLENMHKRSDTDASFVILAHHNAALIPIGMMGLHRINHKDGLATTGAFIGSKDHWSKGLGTDAKMLLLKYAFDSLNLRKISSRVHDFNGRSQRYNEKCGYKVEGLLKQHHFVNGEYRDEILMATFREDFEPLWKKFERNGMTMYTEKKMPKPKKHK